MSICEAGPVLKEEILYSGNTAEGILEYRGDRALNQAFRIADGIPLRIDKITTTRGKVRFYSGTYVAEFPRGK